MNYYFPISIGKHSRFSREIERMLLLSMALHLLLLGAVIFNQYFSFGFAKIAVYQVTLVDLPHTSDKQSDSLTPPVEKKGDKKSEKSSAAKPIKKKEDIRKKEAQVPELKKEEKRSPTPSRTAEERTGPEKVEGGMSGAVSIASDNFKFPYYELSLRNKIERNWSPPPLIKGSSWVRVVIGRNGRVVTTEIFESSGNTFFDQAALRAIYLSDPFPPLPDNYFGSTLMFKVGLEPKEE
ncbi:MAG: TonB family protein [Nitrospirota bacterium]